jgi:hypothetical protein
VCVCIYIYIYICICDKAKKWIKNTHTILDYVFSEEEGREINWKERQRNTTQSIVLYPNLILLKVLE